MSHPGYLHIVMLTSMLLKVTFFQVFTEHRARYKTAAYMTLLYSSLTGRQSKFLLLKGGVDDEWEKRGGGGV